MPRRAWSLLSRRTWWEWVLVGTAVLALAGIITHTNGTTRADRLIYDRFMRLQAQSAPADIAIIAIDEKSLEQLGRWPWPRRVHAQLIGQLAVAKPAVLALDILMPETSGDSAVDDDAVLAAAMRQAPFPIVLPVAVEDLGVRNKPALPVLPLRQAAAALGHVHVQADDDGLVRSVYLHEGFADVQGEDYPHLSVAALQAAKRAIAISLQDNLVPATAPIGEPWQRRHLHGIRYVDPASFMRVSYVDVLNGRVDMTLLAGKTVLVGTTAIGLFDAYPTSLGGNDGLLAGVEIIATVMANAQHSARAGQGIALAPAWVRWLLTALLVLGPLLALLFLPPRHGLVVVLAVVGVVLAGSYLLMARWGWWVPPLAMGAALLAALPLWSWRRLEAALSQIANETQLLAAESSPLAPLLAMRERSVDVVDERLGLLRHAGRRVRDLRRALTNALEELPDAAWIVGLDGGVLLANRDAQLLTQRRFVDSNNVYAVLQYYSVLLEATQAELLGETPFTWPVLLRFPLPAVFEEGVEARDAQGRVVLVKTAFLPDTGGPHSRDAVIVSVVDLTVIRQLEEQREEALRFLSHDIRSPQASILALLDTHDGKDHAALHERIRSAAQSTLRLADGFVQFARAENAQSYQFEAQDLDAMAQEAADEVWAQAHKAGVRIMQNTCAEPVWVNADRSLMWRAIVNLLNNAVKFSPPGGVVSIDVQQTKQHARVSITDQGPGMSEAQAGRLFTNFSRLPSAQRKDGVGLGLAFVKAVAQQHSGRVEVVSTLGQGSTFSLEIPVLEATQLLFFA
jgi:CHASE2 domain-containing sensor protein/signal transduction histidine kinase